MNCISKAILLSAVGLCVDSGSLTFASTQIPLSIPKKSGISTLHIHHTYIRHTIQRLNLSSRLFDEISTTGRQVASVCFITDAGNCSGQEFGNLETPEGTNRPDYDTIPEQCRDAGYTKTSCPAGQHLVNPCPSDNRYYERCDCNENLTEICTIPYYGVGPSCGGKYQSCQCPSSYKSCDCGGAVGASSCTINGKTTYSSCKACCDDTCPSGYSKSYPGGCYDTRSTGCGTTCYKSKACCDDTCASGYSKTKPSGCYDTKTTACGNTCYKAKECCVPYASETNCPYGTTTASDGCGGTRTVCKDCSYTLTAYDCSAQCKNVGSQSCTKNGTIYYASCGTSKCSKSQSCDNGRCARVARFCCDDTGRYCGGYSYCTGDEFQYSLPDCSDVISSLKAQGCSTYFHGCGAYDTDKVAVFYCEG